MRYWKGKIYKRFRFLWGWMPAHPTFYVRKDIIDQLGLYETHYYSACDYEFMAGTFTVSGLVLTICRN
jgi:hypothetical protein